MELFIDELEIKIRPNRVFKNFCGSCKFKKLHPILIVVGKFETHCKIFQKKLKYNYFGYTMRCQECMEMERKDR